jgi:hypothetical protein
MSPFLDKPLRDLSDVERQRNLQDLRAMATRKDDAAIHADCSSVNNKAANQFRHEAYLIRWALRQIEPEIEGPKQFFDQLAGE